MSIDIQNLIPTPQENKTISEESTEIEIETNAKLNTTTIEDRNQARVSSKSNKETHNNLFIKEHFVLYIAIVVQQVPLLYIPRNVKEALSRLDKDIQTKVYQK